MKVDEKTIEHEDDFVWPPSPNIPSLNQDIEKEPPATALSENEQFFARGRWLFTITTVWNMVGFFYELLHHTHHWWHLMELFSLPLACKAWELRLRQKRIDASLN